MESSNIISCQSFYSVRRGKGIIKSPDVPVWDSTILTGFAEFHSY